MGLVIAYRPRMPRPPKTSECQRAGPKPGGGTPPATLCVRGFPQRKPGFPRPGKTTSASNLVVLTGPPARSSSPRPNRPPTAPPGPPAGGPPHNPLPGGGAAKWPLSGGQTCIRELLRLLPVEEVPPGEEPRCARWTRDLVGAPGVQWRATRLRPRRWPGLQWSWPGAPWGSPPGSSTDP